MNSSAPSSETPEQTAQRRAKRNTRLLWIVILLPVVFVIMAYGYSDQASPVLGHNIRAVDRALGSPVLTVLSWMLR